MQPLSATTHRTITKYHGNRPEVSTVQVAAEYPLTIYVNDQEFATVICTPDHLDEMTVGFLAAEGVIRANDEIKELLLQHDEGIAYVELNRTLTLDPHLFAKRRITSCCGKSRQSFYFFNDAQTAKPVVSDIAITPDQAYRLMQWLHESSEAHKISGGVHNAALAEQDQILLYRADIGRHNTLDKIYGYCLQHNISTEKSLLVVSGTISSEMLLKAAKMGVGILLSKSAPTELALQLADELGITAIGFIREQTMNVYTHAHRVVSAPAFPEPQPVVPPAHSKANQR